MSGPQLAAELLRIHPSLPAPLAPRPIEPADSPPLSSFGIRAVLAKPPTLAEFAGVIARQFSA